MHGTGVRRESYADTFAALTENLAVVRPNFRSVPCYWGDTCGSRLLADGVSIPSGDSARGPETVSEAESWIMLWELLDKDPYYELERNSLRAATAGPLPPTGATAGQSLIEAAVRSLSHSAVGAAARAAGLSDDLPKAVVDVTTSRHFKAAVRRERREEGEFRAVVARAIVARATERCDARLGGTLALDGAHRDELYRALLGALGDTARGAIGKATVNLGLSIGLTRSLERKRKAITSAAAALPGDVLLYLVRGEPLRRFISEAISAVATDGEDIVIIAHSLGGIAALETLITRPEPLVRQLITVGSQAPFLYELNALPSLAFGTRLPPHLPEWINIFDVRDLLGYAAAGVFPGVEDRTVDNNCAFPRSHSAYFRSRNFFEVLAEAMI
ncbi:alpha/beta fold hydrolase [Nocardia beijingensis]|uniref:alpha/beta fold hydrolase n=1 Tax=Nocardia beijingensis TaxID=95162 RepID=UPI0033DBE764